MFSIVLLMGDVRGWLHPVFRANEVFMETSRRDVAYGGDWLRSVLRNITVFSSTPPPQQRELNNVCWLRIKHKLWRTFLTSREVNRFLMFCKCAWIKSCDIIALRLFCSVQLSHDRHRRCKGRSRKKSILLEIRDHRCENRERESGECRETKNNVLLWANFDAAPRIQ